MSLDEFIQDLQAFEAAGAAYLEARDNSTSEEIQWLRGKMRAKLLLLRAKYPLEERLRMSIDKGAA